MMIVIHLPWSPSYNSLQEFVKFVFIAVAGCLCMLFFIYGLLYKRAAGIDTAGLLLLAICCYNTIGGVFVDNYRHDQTADIWVITLYYIVLTSSLRWISDQSFKYWCLLITMLVCMLCEVATGWLQYTHILKSPNTFFLVTGNFSNPSPYSNFLAAVFVFTLVISMSPRQSKTLRIFVVLASSVILLVLMYTMSRSALLAVLGTGSVFLFNKYRYRMSPTKRAMVIAKSALLFLLLAIAGSFYFIKKDSSDGRVVIWKVSKDIAQQNFLTGAGYNRFAFTYNLYQGRYFAEHPSLKSSDGFYVDYTKSALSDVYQVLCEQGVFGLILFLMLAWVIVSGVTKRVGTGRATTDRYTTSILPGCGYGLVALYIAGLFSDPLTHFQIKTLFVFYLAWMTDSVRRLTESAGNKPRYWHIPRTGLVFLMIITGYGTIAVQKRYNATSYLQQNLNQPVLDSKMRPFLEDGDLLAFNRSNYLLYNDRTGEAISLLQAAIKHSSYYQLYINLGIAHRESKNYAEAERNIQIAHNMMPGLIYPQFLLAKIYLETGQWQKWRVMSQAVLIQKPKIPSAEVTAMKEEIRSMVAKKNEISNVNY
jgi:O-antigen polymerase